VSSYHPAITESWLLDSRVGRFTVRVIGHKVEMVEYDSALGPARVELDCKGSFTDADELRTLARLIEAAAAALPAAEASVSKAQADFRPHQRNGEDT
jgi:hypothetical protein